MKGFINKPHLKIVSGSIPRKVENIIWFHKKNKSFNSSSNWFSESERFKTDNYIVKEIANHWLIE